MRSKGIWITYVVVALLGPATVTVTVAVADSATVDWIYDEQKAFALTDLVGFHRALRQLSAFFAHVNRCNYREADNPEQLTQLVPDRELSWGTAKATCKKRVIGL
jgi:hypothetical protein